MINAIQNRSGTAYIRTCVIIIIISFAVSAIIFYTAAISSISIAKRNVKRILDGYVMRNSVEIYSSIKQGNDFLENTDDSFFTSMILNDLKLQKEGDHLTYKDDESETIIRMSEPHITFTKENSLNIQADFNVYIPVRFAQTQLYEMTIPVSVCSGMRLKTGE